MEVTSVKALVVPDIKVIRFRRFLDSRGYFTESFRRSDLDTKPETSFLAGVQFVQGNESFSRKGTLRGLHFQWNPYMGKLVRTIHGHMVDLVLDIRKGSDTFGRMLAYDMPSHPDDTHGEWIWVPPGFAHGNFFLEDTVIEYMCSGEYSPGCEGAISPLSADIDRSLFEDVLKELFDTTVAAGAIISDKDKAGLSVSQWKEDVRSENFIMAKC